MEIMIKKLKENAIIPTHGSEYAAGYDLYSTNVSPVLICPGETKKFETGIAMAIPEGYFGAVYARSGMGCDRNLRPANCVGVIDSDYRGDITVALYNDNPSPHLIDPGTKIAQIVIQKCENISFSEVNELPETVRGENGFGSTGE